MKSSIVPGNMVMRMYGWMDGWMDGMHVCMYIWMDGMCACIYGWMDGWMDLCIYAPTIKAMKCIFHDVRSIDCDTSGVGGTG